jgi:hypothetical protein
MIINAYRLSRRLGLSTNEFYDISPMMLYEILDEYQAEQNDTFKTQLEVAWFGEYFHRQKVLERSTLDNLFKKGKSTKKVVDGEEMDSSILAFVKWAQGMGAQENG